VVKSASFWLGALLITLNPCSVIFAEDDVSATLSAELLQMPESAILSGTVEMGKESVGIYKCANYKASSEKLNIRCYLLLTRIEDGQDDYTAEQLVKWRPELSDNFHVNHELDQLYIINGRGQPQAEINLDKGASFWFVTEFSGGGYDITAARIIFTRRHGKQLRAPVDNLN
jgi:hypothetical protein